MLVEFDEKTGRASRYENQSHIARKLIAGSNGGLQFFVVKLSDFVYQVIAHVSAAGLQCSTGWVHEDGICSEREIYSEVKDHPVHSIECLTDFYDRAAQTNHHMIPVSVMILMEEVVE